MRRPAALQIKQVAGTIEVRYKGFDHLFRSPLSHYLISIGIGLRDGHQLDVVSPAT